LKTSQPQNHRKNITINAATEMKKIILVLITYLICLSCDKQRVFEEFRPVGDRTWSSKNTMHFNVSLSDSAQAYNIYISIRHTGNYEFSNLYLFVTAHSPNGISIRDTVEITLADERGKWLGKGAASVFTAYYPYRKNIRFPLHGIYTFDIEQAMWIKDLKNVTDVGLRIEKAGNPG
jgi:gliding motility-associated lipoprotein GldH